MSAPPSSDSNAAPGPGLEDGAAALAAQLAQAMRDHVRRSLGVPLEDTITSLAFVDHYLRSARDGAGKDARDGAGKDARDGARKDARSETRPPILLLVAAEAGAWYGELVRREIGGQWIGDGEDPRSLRLLLRHQWLHFAPVDQALEVVLGTEGEEGDRMPDGPPLDTAFHAHAGTAGAHARDGAADGTAQDGTRQDDASWLAERLLELPPVAEDEYYTLTCRFETLQLVLELLAAKHAGEGRSPREYGREDYTDVGVVRRSDAAAD